MNPGRAGADGSDCASRSKPEIVMTVKVQRQFRSEPGAHFAYQKFHGFRAAGSEGIDDGKLIRPGIERGAADVLQKSQIRAS